MPTRRYPFPGETGMTTPRSAIRDQVAYLSMAVGEVLSVPGLDRRTRMMLAAALTYDGRKLGRVWATRTVNGCLKIARLPDDTPRLPPAGRKPAKDEPVAIEEPVAPTPAPAPVKKPSAAFPASNPVDHPYSHASAAGGVDETFEAMAVGATGTVGASLVMVTAICAEQSNRLAPRVFEVVGEAARGVGVTYVRKA